MFEVRRSTSQGGRCLQWLKIANHSRSAGGLKYAECLLTLNQDSGSRYLSVMERCCGLFTKLRRQYMDALTCDHSRGGTLT